MLYNLQIKLTSPFLGSQRTKEGIRRFIKTDSGELAVPLNQWQWAMREAAGTLFTEKLDTDAIRFRDIRMPGLTLYRRNWRERGKIMDEMFECIREGSVLTIHVFLPASTEYNATGVVVTSHQFQPIMGMIGELVGLSPWGSKFGYGRFNILHFEKENPSDMGRQQPAGDPVHKKSGEAADLQGEAAGEA